MTRVTLRVCSPTEANEAERRVQNVFLYFTTILMERREKLSDRKRSTRRWETDGGSLGKVCLLEGRPCRFLTPKG
jgi:hypothetical protein